MSGLTRDGTAEDQVLRRKRGHGKSIFPVRLTTSRIGNHTCLVSSLLKVHTRGTCGGSHPHSQIYAPSQYGGVFWAPFPFESRTQVGAIEVTQMWRCAAKANGRRGHTIFPGKIDGFVRARSFLPYSRIEHQEKQALLRARLTPALQRRHHHVLAISGVDGECNRFATPVYLNGILPRDHPTNRFSCAAHNLGACSRAPPLLGPSRGEKCQRRQLSTQRGFPPRRSFPERIFAGAVFLVLAAWGLLFGAFTLLLLPFVGLALYLLRRDFQRGGPSRGLAASVARKMAERAARQFPAGNGGGSVAQWMQRAPTEGLLSTMLSKMLGGGIRGMKLVGVLRGEVKKRACQHPGLMNAIGGDIEVFSDVEMSTVGTAGGSFGPAGGGSARREVPSRVIKAKLRFIGRRAGAGGAGWAEVEVSDWESEKGDDGTEGLEYDRVVVTLDNGKTFDLTRTSSMSQGPNWVRTDGERGKDGKRRPGNNKTRPVEAEFRNK